jgi:hypothetical protein
MIEICAYAANFAWLAAPENAPNRSHADYPRGHYKHYLRKQLVN